MKNLFALLGIGFGVVEFLLTKTVADRMTAERPFIVPLVIKLLSYGAVLVPVFVVPRIDLILPFGIGAGAAVLVTALVMFLYHIVKEKR